MVLDQQTSRYYPRTANVTTLRRRCSITVKRQIVAHSKRQGSNGPIMRVLWPIECFHFLLLASVNVWLSTDPQHQDTSISNTRNHTLMRNFRSLMLTTS
jgi:hypothetical protein